VIVTGEDDLVARVKQLTDGRGVDLIFDALGGDGVHTLAAAARPNALMLIYGFLYAPEVAGSFGTVDADPVHELVARRALVRRAGGGTR
jgi:NADPH:quinone reductase-like Zn-dependent oxidoreductase